jgi:AAA domain
MNEWQQPPDPDNEPVMPPPSDEWQRTHGWKNGEPPPQPEQPPDPSKLIELLSIQAWAARPVVEPDQLLGEVLTAAARMFIVGRTGLGKTLLGFAIACGIATGAGFLHWRCTKPKRVLLIDGEMPEGLIKSRSIEALRRIDEKPKPENLVIYSRYLEDEFIKLCPTIGKMPPLNTGEGHEWLLALIDALGGVDAVILDNVMSLIVGDQKDEMSWSDAMPLVQELTARNIAQLWLNHTGWNTDRQYGSSTKAWPFDAVAVITPLPDDQRTPHEVAFTWSFEFPGKARRRTPDNWADFEACIIRLKYDRWTSEPANKAPGGAKLGKVAPSRTGFYDALVAAINKSTVGPGRTTLATWEMECLRRGLIERAQDGDDYRHRHSRFAKYRTAKAELIGAKWIAVDGEFVLDLKGRWGSNLCLTQTGTGTRI